MAIDPVRVVAIVATSGAITAAVITGLLDEWAEVTHARAESFDRCHAGRYRPQREFSRPCNAGHQQHRQTYEKELSDQIYLPLRQIRGID